jgi:hypothetical protein
VLVLQSKRQIIGHRAVFDLIGAKLGVTPTGVVYESPVSSEFGVIRVDGRRPPQILRMD